VGPPSFTFHPSFCVWPAMADGYCAVPDSRARNRAVGSAPGTVPVGRARQRAPEPAWHRRLRAKRAQDRILVKLGEACVALAKHHGSSVPSGLRFLVEGLRSQASGDAQLHSSDVVEPAISRLEDELSQTKLLCAQTKSVCDQILVRITSTEGGPPSFSPPSQSAVNANALTQQGAAPPAGPPPGSAARSGSATRGGNAVQSDGDEGSRSDRSTAVGEAVV